VTAEAETAVDSGGSARSDLLFDAAPRLILGAYLGWAGAVKAISLVRIIATTGPALWSWSSISRLVPIAAAMTFTLVMGAFVLIRRRRVATLPGLYPRAVAFAGGFLASGVGWLPRPAAISLRVDSISSILILVGSVTGIIVLFWLGRSFSIMPEARQLVTSGPYRLVRHPLYAAEMFVLVGIFLPYAPPWSYIAIVAQLVLQLERMRFEERVLAQAFPEYTAYAARTARLIPGIY
jgi:protein-S-isoprenylcysteine O-methyltransferase Ste14